MFNHDFVPEPFNRDAIVDHEKMTDEINAEMERLEVEAPCESRHERAERRMAVYDRISKNYQTYRERDGE